MHNRPIQSQLKEFYNFHNFHYFLYHCHMFQFSIHFAIFYYIKIKQIPLEISIFKFPGGIHYSKNSTLMSFWDR